jgi:hypothetical protein
VAQGLNDPWLISIFRFRITPGGNVCIARKYAIM